MDKVSEGPEGRRLAMAVAVVLFVVVAAMVGTWLAFGDDPHRGTWGDMFGGPNALFSGLALGGVVVAILLQGQELRLQRHELEETRREIVGQRNALERQDATLQAQLLESSFLELLQQFRKATDRVGWPRSDRMATGPEAFSRAVEALSGNHAELARTSDSQPDTVVLDRAFAGLSEVASAAALTGYLTFLEEILSWLEIAPTDRRDRYLSLLVAQMSQAEHDMVLFFSATTRGASLRLRGQRLGLFGRFLPSAGLRAAAWDLETLRMLLPGPSA